MFSLSAQNLLTITGYTGASPEPVFVNTSRFDRGLIPDETIIPNAALFPGIERRNQYFSNRIISLGVQMSFL